MAKALWGLGQLDPENSTSVDRICGVPYTALPLATLISMHFDIPMLMRRKEAKSYGTKKMIEGVIKPGHNCVIIEDVVTSGSSILETVDALRNEGLVVTDAFIIIDRQQGGKSNLEHRGIRVQSLFTMKQIMQYLLDAGKVTSGIIKDVDDYLARNQAPVIPALGKLALIFIFLSLYANFCMLISNIVACRFGHERQAEAVVPQTREKSK